MYWSGIYDSNLPTIDDLHLIKVNWKWTCCGVNTKAGIIKYLSLSPRMWWCDAIIENIILGKQATNKIHTQTKLELFENSEYSL